MANTKEEYWDVNGTSLHTFRWNVDTLDGTEGFPAQKGSDVDVPGAHGTIYRTKKWASRVLSLSGWISNMDADGVRAAADADRRAQLNSNIQAFKDLLADVNPAGQVTLQKRVRILTTGLVSYTAQVEFRDLTIAYPDGGRMRVLFTVDAVMADPFWYDAMSVPHL